MIVVCRQPNRGRAKEENRQKTRYSQKKSQHFFTRLFACRMPDTAPISGRAMPSGILPRHDGRYHTRTCHALPVNLAFRPHSCRGNDTTSGTFSATTCLGIAGFFFPLLKPVLGLRGAEKNWSQGWGALKHQHVAVPRRG